MMKSPAPAAGSGNAGPFRFAGRRRPECASDLSPGYDDADATYGDGFLNRARYCYVRFDGIVATPTEVEDLIVVVTQVTVKVSLRDRAQDVNHMINRPRGGGRKEAFRQKRGYRPWDFYEYLIQDHHFEFKRIVVEPNRKLSLQKNFHRAEHSVLAAGTAVVTCYGALIGVSKTKARPRIKLRRPVKKLEEDYSYLKDTPFSSVSTQRTNCIYYGYVRTKSLRLPSLIDR